MVSMSILVTSITWLFFILWSFIIVSCYGFNSITRGWNVQTVSRNATRHLSLGSTFVNTPLTNHNTPLTSHFYIFDYCFCILSLHVSHHRVAVLLTARASYSRIYTEQS